MKSKRLAKIEARLNPPLEQLLIIVRGEHLTEGQQRQIADAETVGRKVNVMHFIRDEG